MEGAVKTRSSSRWAMKKAKKATLFLGHLEGVSWRVLDEYPKLIQEMIRGRTGVYALYRQHRLYYVGLASNLMGRLKQHLQDRHKGSWDRFSVYVTPDGQHMKLLESLLLRIVRPPANRVKGGLKGSQSLYNRLHQAMRSADADRRARLLGGRVARNRIRRRASEGTLALAGVVERRMPLRAQIRGTSFRATLRRSGHISFRGELYDSPSAAGKKALGHAVNGWAFWKYKNEQRKWVPLARLRR